MNMKLALYAAAAACASAKYPSEHPFANEKNSPDALIEQQPTLRFTPADGGYVYYYTTSVNTFFVRDGTPGNDNGDSKFPGVHNGHFQFGFVVNFGVQPVLNKAFWNCTAKMANPDAEKAVAPFSAADFLGVVDGKTVCATGECCKEFWDLDNGLGVAGMEKGMPRANKDQPKNHDWLTNRHKANQCDDISEHAYCTMVEGDSKGNCNEFAQDQSVRLTILHCYDSWVKYLATCKVFAAGAYTPKYQYEGQDYLDASNDKQLFVLDTVSRMQDHICYPYSYYYADKANENGAWTKEMTAAIQDEADVPYASPGGDGTAHFEFTWMSPPPPATPTPTGKAAEAPADDKKEETPADDKETPAADDDDDSASAQLMVAALLAGVMLYV